MEGKTDNKSSIHNDEAIRMWNYRFNKQIEKLLDEALYKRLVPHQKTDNQQKPGEI